MELITLENAGIEFIDGDRGKNYPKIDEFKEQGYCLFLSAKNVTNKGFLFDEKLFISQEKDGLLRKGKLSRGDIVITTRGTVGNVALYNDIVPFDNIRINSGMVILRCNQQKYSTVFLDIVFRSEFFQNQIKGLVSGSAVPQLPIKDLKNLKMPNLSLENQKKVIDMVGRLENKIQLNTQINQTLEQIAQTIFKSWFIDFDPVHAKANALASGQTAEQAIQAAMTVISGKNTQELHRLQTANPEQYQQLWEIAEAFPSGVDEEGVPWEWEITTFGNVSQCFDKKRIPLSKRQREQRTGSIPYYGATSVMDYVDEAIFDDIYLLIGEDGSVLKEDGTPFIQYIWGKAWVNNHAHVLQGKGSVSTEQLMLFMASTNITAYVTGAVQMKLNQANMNSIPFVKATDRVNELFFDLIKDLYAKVRANSDENKYLVKIRDELLPKLLGGELNGLFEKTI